jgi:hypothetical protein
MEEEVRQEEAEGKLSDGSSGGAPVAGDEELWSGQIETARARLEELNRRAADFVQENPAVCVLGALGIGYLVGKMASRRWLT